MSTKDRPANNLMKYSISSSFRDLQFKHHLSRIPTPALGTNKIRLWRKKHPQHKIWPCGISTKGYYLFSWSSWCTLYKRCFFLLSPIFHFHNRRGNCCFANKNWFLIRGITVWSGGIQYVKCKNISIPYKKKLTCCFESSEVGTKDFT